MKNKGLVFQTTIGWEFLGCEFLGEMDATVHFDYLPAEPEVLWPTDDAHPGCAEEADITNVMASINGITQPVTVLDPFLEVLSERAIEWLNEQGDEDHAADYEQDRLEREYGL